MGFLKAYKVVGMAVQFVDVKQFYVLKLPFHEQNLPSYSYNNKKLSKIRLFCEKIEMKKIEVEGFLNCFFCVWGFLKSDEEYFETVLVTVVTGFF